ncbi:hypothetical protein MCI89_04560 [Muricomes sp. OA1]|uniref:Uncharacterized protein n=1 Tax=Hungatella hathewayi TaxID=154046 RepID=A0A3E2X246_9FIRM|nr:MULTISPECIES: hypothetical protein [Clostridia]MCH1971619.1 hypothetical protein [Muricomes sp. OA1]RGC35557.1 hypothetical protein DWX41_00780 [Hungatella hathewayi]GKH34921.1 hypothetical protein CE91St64_43280 [Faecalicatena contorta]
MRIEINNGVYTRDDEVMELLNDSEDEYLAALAQKLMVRQERQNIKTTREKERERQKRIVSNRLLDGDTF